MDKITKDGKYAYRKDPFTQVRILCVDKPGSGFPVVSMDSLGNIKSHPITGIYSSKYEAFYDLVPLQEKLPDLWVNVFPDNSTSTFRDKAKAERALLDTDGNRYTPYKDVKTIHYIPAPDQTS